MKFISSAICFIASLTIASATNLSFLKSDAFFLASLDSKKWEETLAGKINSVPYYFGLLTLCGYAGENTLTIRGLSQESKSFILKTVKDQDFCSAGAEAKKDDDFAPRHNHPGVYFYHSSFDPEVHLIDLRYNPNREAERAEYGRTATLKTKNHERPEGLLALGAKTSHGKGATIDAKDIQIVIVSRTLPFVNSTYTKKGVKVRVWKNGVEKEYEITTTGKLKHNLIPEESGVKKHSIKE